MAHQFVDLVVPDPVMLLIVEHGDQHVQMPEQILQPPVAVERDGEVGAVSPLRKARVQRVPLGPDGVAEWFKEAVQESFTAPARQHGQARLQRKRRRRQLGSVLAAARQGGAEDLADSHAQERRRDVRAVVDVRFEGLPRCLGTLARTAEADRVDVQEQRRGATGLCRLRIVDVGPTEGQGKRLEPCRMLVEQIAELGGRPVGGGKRQQHGQSGSLKTGACMVARPGRPVRQIRGWDRALGIIDKGADLSRWKKDASPADKGA